MANLKEIAARAGVSEATVSLAMNDRPGVSPATRDRVLALARELGYRPSHRARSLALRSSQTIGLVVPDIENPFFGALTRHVDAFARAQGFSLFLAVSHDRLEREDRILAEFADRQVDGIVQIPAQEARGRFAAFAELDRRGIPWICATNVYPGYPSDSVMTDYEGGCHEQARHVLARGRRNLRFLVSHDLATPIAKLRVAGWRRACAEANVPFPDTAVIPCARPDFASGYQQARKLLRHAPPDAILAINDIVALGVLRAAREQGIAVPEALAVAGFDDVVFAAIAEVPLTTLRQNIRALAHAAVERLVKRIHGQAPRPRAHVVIPAKLIPRHST